MHSLIFITELVTVLCGLCFHGIRCEMISFRLAPRPAQNTQFNVPMEHIPSFLRCEENPIMGLSKNISQGGRDFEERNYCWLNGKKHETQGEHMRPRQGCCWFGKMTVGIWKGPYLHGHPPACVVLCSGVNAVHPKFMSFSNL